MSTRPHFDPVAVLEELERRRVSYVVVGALARVLQGSDELTDGIDIAPAMSPQNLRKLGLALDNLNARRQDGRPFAPDLVDLEKEPVIGFASEAGEIKIVPEPTGTRGYEDLRHRANREHLGQGLRPPIASPGDLVRMLEAQTREADPLIIETMRRVLELERSLTIER